MFRLRLCDLDDSFYLEIMRTLFELELEFGFAHEHPLLLCGNTLLVSTLFLENDSSG